MITHLDKEDRAGAHVARGDDAAPRAGDGAHLAHPRGGRRDPS